MTDYNGIDLKINDYVQLIDAYLIDRMKLEIFGKIVGFTERGSYPIEVKTLDSGEQYIFASREVILVQEEDIILWKLEH